MPAEASKCCEDKAAIIIRPKVKENKIKRQKKGTPNFKRAEVPEARFSKNVSICIFLRVCLLLAYFLLDGGGTCHL